MTFLEFKKSISKIGKIELPGTKSHEEMLPPGRTTDPKKINSQNKRPRTAGVLALFYPNTEGKTMLVLILRKTYEGVHSAQIAFPGGKMEPEDRCPKETALRETHEEIGVRPETVKVLKTLTKIYIPPSNFQVCPFLGITDRTPRFVPQESEVEAIIEVSLEDFMNEEFLIDTLLSTSYATNIKVRAFELNGHIVWGATGMMLNEVKAILKMIL